MLICSGNMLSEEVIMLLLSTCDKVVLAGCNVKWSALSAAAIKHARRRACTSDG